MSSNVEQLFVIADRLEKLAKDIDTPETFDKDYEKWLKMKSRRDTPASTVPEMKAVRPEQLLEKKVVEEEPLPEGITVIDDLPFVTEDLPPEFRNQSAPSDMKADTYIRTASHFEAMALDLLTAAEKKKLDPKAKVRNRGTVCVPASSAKDKKDHFPINDEAQARNALARVHQYDKVPSWYSGSLKSLQELVSRKVHSKYKGIGKEKSSKKSSLQVSDTLMSKYAQATHSPQLISELQTALNLPATGAVNPETIAALKTFQRAHSINFTNVPLASIVETVKSRRQRA